MTPADYPAALARLVKANEDLRAENERLERLVEGLREAQAPARIVMRRTPGAAPIHRPTSNPPKYYGRIQ